MNVNDLRELYHYTVWANHLVLDAAERLSCEERERACGVSHHSIHGTLVHMLAAEWIWLARWLGDSPTSLLGGEDLAEMSALRERWKQVEDQRWEFIAGLGDEDLLREVHYRNTKGEPFAYPLGPLMQHVVNHATPPPQPSRRADQTAWRHPAGDRSPLLFRETAIGDSNRGRGRSSRSRGKH